MSSDSPPSLAHVREGAVFLAGARFAAGSDVAASRDGGWIAWVSVADGNPELYIGRPGRRPVRVTFTPRHAERAPDWSPDGRRIVFERDGDAYVITVDRAQERLLARNAGNPAWAPDGRVAFERDGWIWTVRPDGSSPRKLRRGTAPAWSRDSRLAYERDGDVFAGNLRVAAEARQPAWSLDGRIAFVRGGAIWAAGRRGQAWLRRGTQPAWIAPPALPRPLLPDLVQLPPGDLSVISEDDRFLLGFRSSVRNAGEGPLEMIGSRPNRRTPVMQGSQVIHLDGGGRRIERRIGPFRYQHVDNHNHWHFLSFARYELRTARGALIGRDRKSGFCLVDRHPAPGKRPVYLDYCREHDPSALRVRTGSSSGNLDIYPAHFHGQNLDITDLPAGRYLLVHHANPELTIRESDYTNNRASLLIALTRRDGHPSVRILRTCPQSERCYPR